MPTITYNELPAAVMELNRKMDLMLDIMGKEPEPADKLFPLEVFQDYIQEKTGKRWARQTIYDNVLKRKIPFEKYGKYLYFRKSAIDEWLANGRRVQQ